MRSFGQILVTLWPIFLTKTVKTEKEYLFSSSAFAEEKRNLYLLRFFDSFKIIKPPSNLKNTLKIRRFPKANSRWEGLLLNDKALSIYCHHRHKDRWLLLPRVVVFRAESGSLRWPWIRLNFIATSLPINRWNGGIYEITSSPTVGVLVLKFPISIRASLFTLTREDAILLSVIALSHTWQPYVSTGRKIEE